MRLRPLVAGLAVLAALALAGCGSHRPHAAPARGPIRLGALLPLSGRSSPSGTEMAAASRLAVDETNRAGGVLGRRVELVTLDDACDPGTAVEAANELVARDITVSVGGYCSSATVPTLPIFRAAGVPMVIPSANSTDLLAAGYDSVFLMSGTTSDEAAFALRFLHGRAVRRLAVIDDGTSYSATLAASTASQAAGTGRPATVAITLSQGAPSYRHIADRVVAAGADAVYFTGYYAEAIQLVRDLRAVHYAGTVMVADCCVDGDLLDKLGGQAEGVYGTALPLPAVLPGLRAWTARYRAAVGRDPGTNSMEAYDAVRVALAAIARAGTADRAAVTRAVAATGAMELLTGTGGFQADGSRRDARFLLLRAHSGVFTLVAEDGPNGPTSG